jgi:hypothetical protein
LPVPVNEIVEKIGQLLVGNEFAPEIGPFPTGIAP